MGVGSTPTLLVLPLILVVIFVFGYIKNTLPTIISENKGAQMNKNSYLAVATMFEMFFVFLLGLVVNSVSTGSPLT